MSFKLRVITAFVVGSVWLISCNPQINYLLISVPEEGSLRLTQYSNESEKIVAPGVYMDVTSQILRWWAAPMLAISPNGEKLAYIGESNGFKNLYLKNIEGGRSVVQRTFNRNVIDMSYSPKGDFISFTENKDGNFNIYMINASEGVAVQQIVATSANELSPSFSSNGENIFYAKAEGAGRYFIWSFNIKSTLMTQYTEGFTPVLLDGGEQIVVTRNSRDGSRGEIWSVHLKKGTETLILSDPKRGFSSPTVSKDGKKIICVGTTEKSSTKPQNLDLYMVNVDGSKLTQLTFHPGHDVSPIWSPDGNSVFFLSQRGNKEGNYNVWKMDIAN